MKRITIAIDGHSSCGKSTMAKQLAKQIGYVYVDSGAMYRAVTLLALRNGLFDTQNVVDEARLRTLLDETVISFGLRAETNVPYTKLNGEDVEDEIRTMPVSSRVSLIAALPFVREALVRAQQQMGADKGIIMDGRDIGTTVFPDAEMKVFVTASAQVRAQRRYDELTAKGEACSFEEILANVETRDRIDSTREVSPLRKADDAVLLDNSDMTREEQLARLLEIYHSIAD